MPEQPCPIRTVTCWALGSHRCGALSSRQVGDNYHSHAFCSNGAAVRGGQQPHIGLTLFGTMRMGDFESFSRLW